MISNTPSLTITLSKSVLEEVFSALGVCVAFSGWGPLSADGASSVTTGVSSCSETSRFLTVTGSAVFTVRTRLRVRSACS
ncbi:hypothetical protein D3C71_1292020 [compost metagenome]